MRICMIAEGCYPYMVGGVSSWIHSMIRSFPEHEFSVVAILSDRSKRGQFVYELPENLKSVYEVYLMDLDWSGEKIKEDTLARLSVRKSHRLALQSLIAVEHTDWEGIFELCSNPKISINQILMSPMFFDIISMFCAERYRGIPFSDFLWTMRSIYLPLFTALKFTPPEADIYHCVATGYSGIIGCRGKCLYPQSRMIVSEHGIYTREREEELIKAHWVQGIYKDIWIQYFHKMSLCAYDYADVVTSLYRHAQELQIELGCPAEKTLVTPNGIHVEQYADAPGKDAEDKYINVGALVRVTPIKDIKTLINAFKFAKDREPRLKLWIMGPDNEDEEYAQECHELVDRLHIEDVVFTGRIQVKEYIGKMDFMILTSISEGQPLTILEGYAVRKPCIATNVGNCQGLIYGEDDDCGDAGIVTPVMNITAIGQAILTLAENEPLRRQMGENGRQRLMKKYRIEMMKSQYEHLYCKLYAGNVKETEKGVRAWPESASD